MRKALENEKPGSHRRRELELHLWWTKQWQDPRSPFAIAKLTEDQERITECIRAELPQRCFPGVYADYVRENIHNEAAAAIESMAAGAKLLRTS